MIFPYPHSAALAQMPVPYFYKGETLTLYPLRLRDIIEMDIWLKSRVVKEYYEQAELLSSDFLGFADKLYLAGSQVDKYAKMWLVGKRDINIGKLDYLVREAYAAARSALNVLRASLSQS